MSPVSNFQQTANYWPDRTMQPEIDEWDVCGEVEGPNFWPYECPVGRRSLGGQYVNMVCLRV